MMMIDDDDDDCDGSFCGFDSIEKKRTERKKERKKDEKNTRTK